MNVKFQSAANQLDNRFLGSIMAGNPIKKGCGFVPAIIFLIIMYVVFAMNPEMFFFLLILAGGFCIWAFGGEVIEKLKDWKDEHNFGIGKLIVVILALVFLFGIFSGTGGGGSSGRSWNDLSPVEQSNARWAYEAKQFIDGR